MTICSWSPRSSITTRRAHFTDHLRRTGTAEHGREDAALRLLEWFEDVSDEPILGQQVAIVLAAANFSQEITTTVLWLNGQYGTVRGQRGCVQHCRSRAGAPVVAGPPGPSPATNCGARSVPSTD